MIIDPLSADPSPERMVVRPGDAGFWIEGEGTGEVLDREVQKAFAIRPGLPGEQLGRSHEEEGSQVARGGIVQIEDHGEAAFGDLGLHPGLGRRHFGIMRGLEPIAVVIVWIRLLAAVTRDDAIDVHDGHDHDLRSSPQPFRLV